MTKPAPSSAPAADVPADAVATPAAAPPSAADGERRVGLGRLLAYGAGDIFGVGAFGLIGLLFIYFLTDVVGLEGTLAGLVVLIGKGWDAVSDPLMGHLSDRTRSRFGRRRIYFIIGLVPIALGFSLLWLPVSFASQGATFAYYAAVYVFFSTVFTMVMVPYAALNAEMSRDYRTRTRLSGARMIFGGLSTLVVGVVPKLLVDAMGSPQRGHLVMGVVFGVFFALPWLAVFFGTWELPRKGYDRRPPAAGVLSSLLGNLRTIFSNRSFRVHMGMYISAYSAIDILMATILYFMTYYFGRKGIFPVAVGFMLVAQLGMLLAYVAIANRYGKGRAYIVGLTIWVVGMLAGLALGRHTATPVVVAIFVVAGMGMAAGAMMPWAILPSITDVDELISGEQRAGVYAGTMTLVRKLVQAAVLFGVGAALSAMGYVPNQEQSAETLVRLKLFFHLAPSVCLLLGILCATRFRITPTTHAVLTAELERLRAGGSKAEVSPETRAVCELLTGRPYQELYGKRS